MEIRLITSGDIMRNLNLSRTMADYWIRAAGVQPIGRVGQANVYDPSALATVRDSLNRHRAKAATTTQLTPA